MIFNFPETRFAATGNILEQLRHLQTEVEERMVNLAFVPQSSQQGWIKLQVLGLSYETGCNIGHQ